VNHKKVIRRTFINYSYIKQNTYERTKLLKLKKLPRYEYVRAEVYRVATFEMTTTTKTKGTAEATEVQRGSIEGKGKRKGKGKRERETRTNGREGFVDSCFLV